MGVDERKQEKAAAASTPQMAPRWLSGGRADVRLEDNPAALAYGAFLRSLSSIFLQEQKHQTPPPPE